MHPAIERILRATALRTAWGINLSTVSCPRCGAGQPRIRRPRNARQRLWGGWTCRACGCEMDKWGRPVAE